MRDTILTVDAILLDILNVIESSKSGINVMVFSDHGMVERVGGPSDASAGLINVLDYVSSDDWDHAYGSTTGPVLSIWPKDGKLDSVSMRNGAWTPNT